MTDISTIKYLTQDELKRLFAAIEAGKVHKRPLRPELVKRNMALFLVAYRHGLRASEVGMLTLQDVNMDAARIRIHRAKGSHGGEYPMDPDELRRLKAYLKERGKFTTHALFPSLKDRPIGRRTLDDLMKCYGEKANIPVDKRHFHVLRHSIATHLLDAGAGIRFVQDWLGHANIMSTTVYAQITNPARDQQAQRFFSSTSIVSP